MQWCQILIAVITLSPVVYVVVYEIIICSIKENIKYKKKFNKWNEDHPELQRRLCKTCKYSIKETNYIGRYRNSIPIRKLEYCTLIKKKINIEGSRCMLAEPPKYFFEPKNKKELYTKFGTEIYFSAYGNCFHSTKNCRSIKNSRNVYKSILPFGRYPCPKCWKEEDGYLVPK